MILWLIRSAGVQARVVRASTRKLIGGKTGGESNGELVQPSK